MTLISGSGEPLYLQLKRNIRDLILRELKPGDRIPSETEICNEYSVSRAVVRQAMTALEFEGLLEKIQGRGTFVADGPLRHDSVRQAWPSDRNLALYSLVSLDVVEADEHIAIPLGFSSAETRVVRIRLVSSVENARASYHVLYISGDLLRESLTAVQPAPAVQIFEQLTREHVIGVEHTITAIRNDENRAHYLQLPVGIPLMLDQGIYTSDKGNGRAMERTFIASARSAVVFREGIVHE